MLSLTLWWSPHFPWPCVGVAIFLHIVLESLMSLTFGTLRSDVVSLTPRHLSFSSSKDKPRIHSHRWVTGTSPSKFESPTFCGKSLCHSHILSWFPLLDLSVLFSWISSLPGSQRSAGCACIQLSVYLRKCYHWNGKSGFLFTRWPFG